MLKTSSAQANAVKRVLRFTAKYLQKEIFRIVAASVTGDKVTKVTAPIPQTVLSCRVPARESSSRAGRTTRQEPAVVYNHSMSDPRSDTDQPIPSLPPLPRTQTGSDTHVHPSINPNTSPARNPGTEFRIGEEFGTAKRNLPPVRIVLICIAAVAIVVGIFAFKERPKPQGAGSIDFVSAAEVPGQDMILSAITLTLRNTAEKPLWIHTLKAQLTTADGKTFEDEAASAVDLDRYYQAFPALKESSEPPLSPETKLLAGAQQKGTIIVGLKVAKEAFDQRKSLTVTIQPYDQVLPIILK
ncbi:MAG: hypothetical protein ABSB87_10540 [Terriglobales bacterium]